MYVMGGGRVAPNPSNEVDIYDPGTNTWTLGQPFVNARRNFPTDTDGTNDIWLAGGYDMTGVPVASMEIFCAAGATPTPTPSPTATPTVTFSDTNSNTFGDTISDANGDPIADRHAQSDAAATPDTVSTPNAVREVRIFLCEALCGQLAKELASCLGGTNGLHLLALAKGGSLSLRHRCNIAKPVSVLGEAADLLANALGRGDRSL